MHPREVFNKFISLLVLPLIILIFGLTNSNLFIKSSLALFSFILFILAVLFIIVNHYFLKIKLTFFKNILISIVFILIIIPIVFMLLNISFTQVSSFEECEKAGYDIMEIFPPKCKTPTGKVFSKVLEKEYISKDLDECKITVIMCEKGIQFQDESGCGCQF
jgi:hypothetical protein